MREYDLKDYLKDYLEYNIYNYKYYNDYVIEYLKINEENIREQELERIKEHRKKVANIIKNA